VTRYEHSADLGWKMQSEGSIQELIFGYGLLMEDLPNDMPSHIRAFVRQCNAVSASLDEIRKYLEKAVDEYDYADWDAQGI